MSAQQKGEYAGPTKPCSVCRGRKENWTDCGDSTCDCDGTTRPCRTCNATGREPDYEAAYQELRDELLTVHRLVERDAADAPGRISTAVRPYMVGALGRWGIEA